LQYRAAQLKIPIKIEPFDLSRPTHFAKPGQIKIIDVSCPNPEVCGIPTSANANYVIETIKIATQGCLDNTFAAMVTAPVHKATINNAGIPFQGHTELIAHLTHTPHVVMMLLTKNLRVALVTTHLPLAAVASAITTERLRNTIHILHRDLQQRFGITTP